MINSSTKSIAITNAWKERNGFTHKLSGTKIHNCWRAIRFTVRGKIVGCDPRWDSFQNFANDMLPSYKEGWRICREDKKKHFSKQNCFWAHPDDVRPADRVFLEYNGETKILKEWCLQFGLHYNGVRQRYYKGNRYSAHEILFGKKKKSRKPLQDASGLTVQGLRNKASKMIAAYKCRDKKYRHKDICDLTIEWFIENILQKSCIYCQSSLHIGADRKNNYISHIKSNIVPSCFRCNSTRGNRFTYEQMLKIGKFIQEEIDVGNVVLPAYVDENMAIGE